MFCDYCYLIAGRGVRLISSGFPTTFRKKKKKSCIYVGNKYYKSVYIRIKLLNLGRKYITLTFDPSDENC